MAALLPFTAVLVLHLRLETADSYCMQQASLQLHLCASLAVLFSHLPFWCGNLACRHLIATVPS